MARRPKRNYEAYINEVSSVIVLQDEMKKGDKNMTKMKIPLKISTTFLSVGKWTITHAKKWLIKYSYYTDRKHVRDCPGVSDVLPEVIF